jgi:cytoplasmic iron level regulating protein YaaA (DUF328/UPF0246 family)
VLILLPPSETKRPGGVGVSIDRQAIIWASLDPQRDKLIAAVTKLCKKPEAAAKALGLGKRNLGDIDANLNLMTAPTMPALERYTGVLYDAIDFESLSVEAKRRAGELLFIQSALFGLLPAMEQIPYYRFSAGSKLQGINLKQLWMEAHQSVWPRLVGPVLDMRSKVYVELNPVPADRTSWFVEVVDQHGKALNHFNKKAKGLFVRQALEDGLAGIDDLPKVAKFAGMRAEIEPGKVILRAPKGL